MHWLENFLEMVRRYYRPARPVPVDCGEIIPNDIIYLVIPHWPNIANEGKLKIRSPRYKLKTFDSIERYLLHCKCHSRYQPYVPGFHECGHFAADALGQICHNPDWTGTAFGTIIYAPEIAWHEENIVIGCDSPESPIPKMRFWNAQDGMWRANSQVIGHPVDTIWIP